MTIAASYSAVAGLYIDLFGSPDKSHPDDLAFIARHLSGLPGPVLDLGCGPGHLTGYLHGLGADVSGVDLVPEFVEHARATHPGLRFRLGSMDDLDAGDASIAGLLVWYSLIHRDPQDVPEVLAELRRVLVPGGSMVVGFFTGAAVEPFEHKVTTAYRWPPDELSAVLGKAGFTEVDRLDRPDGDGGAHRPHAAIAVQTTR
ncbi:methyltransferase domain-containing protein [Dactylosporangium sp. NPDC051541]|uniref:class I SAM-dependent methyltransferase n=1 Tax=Dactylosporangium sp. NPDC051541 TaxID=3363977 RepID=UPI0037A1E63D